MKIIKVDVFGYQLTYAHGEYVMSGGRAARAQDSTVVRLRTDDGQEGWGETSSLAGTYLPAFTGGTRAALAVLGEHLIGLDPTNLSLVHDVMDGLLLGQNAPKGAGYSLLGSPWPASWPTDLYATRRSAPGGLPALRGGAAWFRRVDERFRRTSSGRGNS